MAQDGRWIACRPNFFLPIHVLSRLFRRRFIERLVQAHDAGELPFFGDLLALNAPEAFAGVIPGQRRINWIVYAKPPFGSPQHVLAYLGRYTHRVAIANSSTSASRLTKGAAVSRRSQSPDAEICSLDGIGRGGWH